MVTKKIMLLGAGGQIGKALQLQALPADWQLGVFDRAACDFMRPGDINRAIQGFAPDLVVNAAALTGIEACEQDRDAATHINFNAVANIAGQCVQADAPLIQISTDYVFDGQDGGRPYLPDDAMNPLNVYGQTKMMGEEAARHGLYWHVVLRTSLVFSELGDNVLTRLLRRIDAGEEIEAAVDQVACPTSAHSVARGLVVMADAILDGKANCFGTFHLCDTPAVSRFEFVQAVAETYVAAGGRAAIIKPVVATDMGERIARPAYSALDCGHTQETFGIAPRNWRTELAAVVEKYIKKGKS